MNLSDKTFNELIVYLKKKIDLVAKKYNYTHDIKRILYISIPAFIIKYGFDNKDIIIKALDDVPIILQKKVEKVFQAFYTSIPFKIDSKIITKKCIVLYQYDGKPFLELMDNIIHEYNHAVNSMLNEIKEDDEYVYLRTGLMYSKYSKNYEFENSKDESYILEEIINTKQTEEIVDIINSFNKYEILDSDVKEAISCIGGLIDKNYKSEAYFLQSKLCQSLMNNHTLISVLASNRFLGNIDGIEFFFDNITGEDGSYKEIINILNKSVKLEEEYSKSKLFRMGKIRKIRNLYLRANQIIDLFNFNYHFK